MKAAGHAVQVVVALVKVLKVLEPAPLKGRLAFVGRGRGRAAFLLQEQRRGDPLLWELEVLGRHTCGAGEGRFDAHDGFSTHWTPRAGLNPARDALGVNEMTAGR